MAKKMAKILGVAGSVPVVLHPFGCSCIGEYHFGRDFKICRVDIRCFHGAAVGVDHNEGDIFCGLSNEIAY